MSKIELFKVYMSDHAPERVRRVLLSGFVGQGKEVDLFEAQLRAHFNHPWANTVNSCTSGLQLAVRMFTQPGDEVLTTPLTCTATNWAILANNTHIRWVDVNPNDCNISVEDCMRKLSPKTKVIMVVHWGGYACNLEGLRAVQDKCESLYGFRPTIIEDCAHAWGARYQGKLVGTHGNPAVFSFQAIKHLTTGDGGLVLSPDEATHKRAKLLRWYGLDRESSEDFRCQQNIQEWGYKFHMNDITAAIGICNLPEANELVNTFKDNGRYYDKRLRDVPGVTLLDNQTDRESSYWIYTMRVQNRADFIKKMKEHKIIVSQIHDRNDKHLCVQDYRAALPGMDALQKDMICIPSGWWVTKEDREYVANCIEEGW